MPELMTIAEACALLRISKVTLREWHKAGRIAYVRLGRHCIRLLADDVQNLVNSNRGVPING
jgi:excisionase family DNA binding protein